MHDSIGVESTMRDQRGLRDDAPAGIDADVVRAAQRRDHRAFALIVEAHQERLNALVYHIVQDRGATQDVVQDALLCAYRALPQFRGDAALGTWLYRIAYSAARCGSCGTGKCGRRNIWRTCVSTRR